MLSFFAHLPLKSPLGTLNYPKLDMTDGGLNASQGYWLFKMYEVSN